jgi:hypothetical protein
MALELRAIRKASMDQKQTYPCPIGDLFPKLDLRGELDVDFAMDTPHMNPW